MKSIIISVVAFLFCSCEGFDKFFPQSTFDAPYPDRNINIENEIGDYLVIKKDGDTLYLRLSGDKNNNTICNMENGDTLFNGTVSLYKGLYYFTQAVNDSTFWIYAAKFNKDLVYGIGAGHEQALYIDEEILKGDFPDIVKYIDTSRHRIRLHPKVETLHALFTIVINKMSPDTIIFRTKPVLLPGEIAL